MENPERDLLPFMQRCRERVASALEKHLPSAETHPRQLHQAMRYAVLDGGKRIRPVLVYASGAAVGAPESVLDAPACAVELIHAYSLVHDDLPAMDDDDLRRGKPSCHKAFGEAVAILAGDALQTLAFRVLAHNAHTELPSERGIRLIDLMTHAVGSRGMAGGQAIDLASVGCELSFSELEDMHIHKTGALIRASVLLGALCQIALDEAVLERLDHYAKCIGLAFQIQDDILDVKGKTSRLGKTTGADEALDKPTYPALLGLKGARQRADELLEDALQSLSVIGKPADPLRWIAHYIVQRDH